MPPLESLSRIAARFRRATQFGKIHWPWIAALVCFCATVWLPVVSPSPTGDVSRLFNDHVRHAFTSHVFLTKGFALYQQPMNVTWAGIEYPHAQHNWGEMALAYPPGQIALFLPPALLGRYVPMSTSTFGSWIVGYLLLLTCMGLVAWFKVLDRGPPGVRLALALLTVPMLLHLALEGFFDPVWLVCGALMILRLQQDRPASALRWFAAAGLLQYRSVILVPLAVLALWRALRGRPPRSWPWFTLAAVSVMGGLVLVTFYWMYPNAAPFRPAAAPLRVQLDTHPALQSLVVVTFVTFIWVAALRHWLLLATLAIGTAIAVTDFQGYYGYWHHASAVLIIPLLAGLIRPPLNAVSAQAMTMLWVAILQAIVWMTNPVSLLLAFFARLLPVMK